MAPADPAPTSAHHKALTLSDHERNTVIAFLTTKNESQTSSFKAMIDNRLPDMKSRSVEAILKATFGKSINSYIVEGDNDYYKVCNKDTMYKLFKNRGHMNLTQLEKDAIILILKRRQNYFRFHKRVLNAIPRLQVYTVGEILSNLSRRFTRDHIERRYYPDKHGESMLFIQLREGYAMSSDEFSPALSLSKPPCQPSSTSRPPSESPSLSKMVSTSSTPASTSAVVKALTLSDPEKYTVLSFLLTKTLCDIALLKNITNERLPATKKHSAESILRATFGNVIEFYIEQEGSMLTITHDKMDKLYQNKFKLKLNVVEKEQIKAILGKKSWMTHYVFQKQVLSSIPRLMIYTVKETWREHVVYPTT